MYKAPNLSHTRNIGIAAHVDAGKTTLTERILFYTGASYKIGEVHNGAAHMDYLAEEQFHGNTITAAVTRTTWNDHQIQIVDTPGHVDFTIEVERAMRVLDGCIIVLDGVRGIEPQTETVWRQRQKFAIPCLFFIKKMDRAGAEFNDCLEHIRHRLEAEPVPVTVPLPQQHAVVHLIEKTLIRFEGKRGESVQRESCDDATWASVRALRESMLLTIAETNESLADQVLAGEEPDQELIWAALRQATLAGSVYPCFGGAALRNQGVQPLLDGIVRLLPAPPERPPACAIRPDGREEIVRIVYEEPLVALVFKVQMWDGRRHVYARIYRNRLRPNDTVAILRPDGGQIKEHVARIFDMDANRRNRLDEAVAGQIVLLAGLRRATTGDTLCDPRHLLTLERIEARDPVLSLAIESLSSDDDEKFLEVLDKLLQEDPTLRLKEDSETGQRLLSGMGELHLQIVVERLEREFHLHVRTGKPAVALRETITHAARADVSYHSPLELSQKTQEIEARAVVGVTPRERNTGVRILIEPTIKPVGQQVSPMQAAAINEGLRLALASGPREGATLLDLDIKVEEL